MKKKEIEESIQGADVILSSLRSNILQKEHARTGVKRHAVVEKLFKIFTKLRIAGRVKENIRRPMWWHREAAPRAHFL